MHVLKAAALALALLTPGLALAATDGTPGVTSTGTVGVALTVNPPATSDTVQIIGLQDFDFGTIPVTETAQVNIDDYVCFNRSGPGIVGITISQASNASSQYRLFGALGYSLPVFAYVRSVDATNAAPMTNNVAITMPASAPSCNAASGMFEAFFMRMAIIGPNGDANAVGSLSGQFTVTIAPG